MDRYAVVGQPVAHSLSPQIHAAFAAALGIELSYEAIEAPLDGFAATVADLFDRGYRGVNVTVPFVCLFSEYLKTIGGPTQITSLFWARPIE